MHVKICGIEVELKSKIPAVCQEWQEIFANHLSQSQITPAAQIKITAALINEAPPTKAFSNQKIFHSADGSYTRSQNDQNQTRLNLASGAVIIFDRPNKDSPLHGELFVSQALIHNGQLEDVTLTLLAPLFRKKNIFIVHAFGAVHPTQQKALLIVGPSGSGKTTTGLSLIEEGWHFLGNDAIFLSQNTNGKITAWPSPGRVNIHPNSIPLLKQPNYISNRHPIAADGKYHLSPSIFSNPQSNPTPVTALIFTQISSVNIFNQHLIPQSVALTKLMEQSVDNWDVEFLDKHFSFLQSLATQTHSYSASLTQDLSKFSQQIAVTFSNT